MLKKGVFIVTFNKFFSRKLTKLQKLMSKIDVKTAENNITIAQNGHTNNKSHLELLVKQLPK